MVITIPLNIFSIFNVSCTDWLLKYTDSIYTGDIRGRCIFYMRLSNINHKSTHNYLSTRSAFLPCVLAPSLDNSLFKSSTVFLDILQQVI